MKPGGWLLLGLGLPLLGWAPEGHRLAAEGALRTLPPSLRAWYQGREAELARTALEPDAWKERDPEEAARHHLFTETYGGPAKVPLSAAAARGQVGAWAFQAGGQLPWVIAERYRLLVTAFRGGEPGGVVAASGWLCHYVADAQVPLHTTRNHNGKLTGQKGVHKRWERDLLRVRFTDLPELRPAQPPADLPLAVSGWIVASHALVDPLLGADRRAAQGAARGEGMQEGLFRQDQQGALLQQLRHAAESTGDLLLAAWTEAGKPLLP